MLVTKYRCNDIFPMLPDRGVRTSEQYYGYNTINSSSAATGYQKANNITVYLFQDMRDGNLSLHVVLDGYGNTGSGSATITASNLPSGWELASSDDTGEMAVLDTTTARGNFSWEGPNTDGFSIQGIKDFTSITITLDSITKLTTWNICSYTGKTLSLPISSNQSITITRTVDDVDINSLVQPDPSPGNYASAPGVTLNYSPNLKIKQSISATPSNAKIIAFDTLTPPNPFIAVVDDGRGRVVLDGGFPKFYNSQYSGATSYTQLNAAHKYLYNAMNWVADPARVLAGKTSFLLFNDGPSSYDLGTFSTTMSGVAGIAGFSIVQKNRTNFGGATTVSIPYSEFNDYCGVIVMSTKTDGVSGLSDTTANLLKQYRESGGGIIVITDHDVFQATANAVVSKFGASFFGDINRSPVSVQYLKDTYGIHPLWNNIPGSVYAGGSEGNVAVTNFSYYNNETIQFPGNGIHTIYVLIEDEDENFFSTTYSYLVNVEDPITVLVNGTPIPSGETIYTVQKNFLIDFSSIRINNLDTSGVIKKEGVISGEFSVSPTFTTLWYNDNNRISVTKSLKYLEFSTVSPIPYTRISGIRRYTAASHPLKLASIMAASRGAELENYWRSTAANIKQIREYSERLFDVKLPSTASSIRIYFDPELPDPTYNITSSASSVNESGSITFTITTSDVPEGTTCAWSISGVGVSDSDFTTPRSGTITIIDSRASVTLTLSADNTTEGNESFQFILESTTTPSVVLARMDLITINDTSLTPAPPPVLPPGIPADNAAWGGNGFGGTVNYRGGYSASASHQGNGGGGGASPLGGEGGSWATPIGSQGEYGTGASGGGYDTAGIAGTGGIPGYDSNAVNATGVGNGGGGVETDGANANVAPINGGDGTGGLLRITIKSGSYLFTSTDLTAFGATRLIDGGKAIEWDNSTSTLKRNTDDLYQNALLGTFTVPAGVTVIDIGLIAGGGGGATGPCVNAGGGGGGASLLTDYAVVTGVQYIIKVGAGGQGGRQPVTRNATGGPPYGVSEAPWRGGRSAFCLQNGTEIFYATGGNTRPDNCAAVTNSDTASAGIRD